MLVAIVTQLLLISFASCDSESVYLICAQQNICFSLSVYLFAQKLKNY